jgi:tetratricopeptide (TPR) repeat protein
MVGVLLAQLRAAQDERNEAVGAEAAIRAVGILEKRFGQENLALLPCMEEAMAILTNAGRSTEAVTYAQRACRIWDAVPENARDKLLAADCRRRLGWYLALSGRPADGIVPLRRAVEELRAEVGNTHHTFALCEGMLAYCLFETGDVIEADRMSERALAVAQKLALSANDQMSHLRFIRGHVLAGIARTTNDRDKLQQAAPLLQNAWERMYIYSNRDIAWRRVALADLAGIYDTLGEPAKAQEWRNRVTQVPAWEGLMMSEGADATP